MKNKCLLYFIAILSLYGSSYVQAQVVPDSSLPHNSEVIRQENTIQINGGTENGTNLFHSFEQFSIKEGEIASFNNASAIANIFSRITGKSASNISGLIKTNGSANLFLINPNGIIFGEKASLDVGGSFFASSAESVIFNDNLQFSTTNPETIPLLTISVPIGLQFGSQPGSIINRSQTTDSKGALVGLQVPTEKTLGLIGGEIAIERGILKTPGGRIDLGSVAENNRVNLIAIEKGYALSYDDVENFQNIQFSPGLIDSSGDGGGDIQIQGKQISISDGSRIDTSTLGANSGGTLKITASELVELINNSVIFADVSPEARGSGANLNIETPIFKITDGAFISVATFGEGNGGDVTIISTDKIELIQGAIFVDVLNGATGNGGNLTLETGNLQMTNGSQLVTGTSGRGNGGEMTVKANKIEMTGTRVTDSGRTVATGLFASVNNPEATGKAGNIFIDAERLSLSDGAQVFVGTFGLGDAGKLTVQSDYIELTGTSEDTSISSGFFIDVEPGASGNADTLTIKSKQISLFNGAQISASTFGSGNAGDLEIEATDIEVIGRTEDFRIGSGIFAQVNLEATGTGGNLIIDTSRLLIADGAQVSVGNLGQGEAGDLIVKAEEINVIGQSVDGQIVSGLISGVDSEAKGNGGNLSLETKLLRIADGANVLSSTFSSGNAGYLTLNVERLIISNGGTLGAGSLLKPEFREEKVLDNIRGQGGALTLNATEYVEIVGKGNVGDATVNSSIFTRAEGTGNAGNLEIVTPQLTITDEGNINVSATGTGEAGSLKIDSQEITLDRGNITAETRAGDRGNINLNKTTTLLLRNDSQITTNAKERATGGDISINSEVIALLDKSDITANAVEGKGGNISLNTQGIFLEPNSKITASSELGIDGTIAINSPDVDPTSEVFQLSDVPIDAEAILAQDICKLENEKIAKGSSFVVTGRGGLTPTSEDSLANADNVVGWANRDDLEISQNGFVGMRQRKKNRVSETSYPIVQQSQGWVTTSDGTVWLVANAPQTIPQNSHIVRPDCGAFSLN